VKAFVVWTYTAALEIIHIQIISLFVIEPRQKVIQYPMFAQCHGLDLHDDITAWTYRGGSRVGTVELQHPLLPLGIIDNI
jgi:hypothetical protein